MDTTIDEATSRFVQRAALDLQQQLSVAGSVETISAQSSAIGMTLVAIVRVADRRIEVAGHGETLVTAYGDLRRQVAGPTLIAAFNAVMDLGSRS